MAKDPVSGNEIPLGSTAEEVRDDQPAMLSEGEFVIPADVVRYFGVQYFMDLRDKAKMGYEVMNKMGQLGNSEDAAMPDDTLFNRGMPFTIDDIEVVSPDELKEKMEDAKEDDVIEAADGAYVAPGQMQLGNNIDVQTDAVFNSVPRYGRDPVVPEPIGLGQFYGEGSAFGTRPTYYMSPDSVIHTTFDITGMTPEEEEEDWIQITSPAEIRNYAEVLASMPATTEERETVEALDQTTEGEDDPNAETYDVSAEPGALGAVGRGLSAVGDAVTNTIGGAVDAFGRDENTVSKGQVTDDYSMQDPDASSDSDKIICTAMVQQYGFGAYRQKLWLHYGLDMHPAYQKGYHAIFRPIIRYVYDKKRYNKRHVAFLRRWLENGARRRTIDIRNETRDKRVLLHRLERHFWESVCFIVGKLK